MTTISIKKGINYLSEVMTELPIDCIFDKGKVGCGGTTIAINSNKPYVIAVPFVSLVENKVSQHSNIFAVYEGVSVIDIKNYIKSTECPKIMTTYDSLGKVTKAIGDDNNFSLLVDELHILFLHYSFRSEAVNTVLKNYNKYMDYCFMTATVLEEEFILDEIKHLPTVTAVWEDVEEVTVHSTKCLNGVTNSLVDLVNDFLTGKNEGNAYIFVNSVETIKTVVEHTKVNIDNCNVIYSKSNRTEVGLDRGILPSDKNGSIPTKKINLLTSTVFEGSDIYDENGRIYIVSDSSKAHTLIDISTSFQQIAGRVRNSKYIKQIEHFYTNTRYNQVDYETFKQSSIEEIETTKRVVDIYNGLPKEAKDRMQLKCNVSYIDIKDDVFFFNANLVKVDMYNYKVCSFLYKIRVNNTSNLQKELEKHNYTVINTTLSSTTNVSSTGTSETFEEVVLKLEELSEVKWLEPSEVLYRDAAYKKYQFLEEAINKLGFTGIKEENYIITNIKRKIVSTLDINTNTKIFKLLKTYDDIKAGNFVALSTLKERFKSIYSQLGLEKTPKATDIKDYFITSKEMGKWVNGKNVKGYTLFNPKMIINN